MTDENQEVELHDEVTDEIVEDTLGEAAHGSVAAKGKAGDAQPTDETDSNAATDKAADGTSQAKVPGGVANQGEKKPKTKAGMISAMFNKMNGMSKADVEGMYQSYHKESVDMEEDEVIAETSVDTATELDALVESEATLSDEFKAKTAVLFETALKSKLSEEVDRLEEQYQEELSSEIEQTKSELVEKVDNYLNYVVETWMEENKVAIESGLRTEIAENFMTSLKDLFTESYIEVPESKVDLVDELAEQVEELETKLNDTTQKVIDTTGELEEYKRESIIRENSRDLADTQVEKLKTLLADIDFDSEEKFAEKVETVKESYFTKQVTSDEEILDEDTTDNTVEISDSMDKYVQAIRKTVK
jgi:hypothetical protein